SGHRSASSIYEYTPLVELGTGNGGRTPQCLTFMPKVSNRRRKPHQPRVRVAAGEDVFNLPLPTFISPSAGGSGGRPPPHAPPPAHRPRCNAHYMARRSTAQRS